MNFAASRKQETYKDVVIATIIPIENDIQVTKFNLSYLLVIGLSLILANSSLTAIDSEVSYIGLYRKH